MISTSSKDSTSDQVRSYERAKSVVFRKTKESFGGLSNMASGFPLRVNGIRMLTSEALYQACRFPYHPDVQRLIIGEHSPMTAKMKSKPHRQNSRPDWDQVRVKIMRWCLRVKLAQNWNAFSKLLLETGDRAIVEESRKDDFWGAKPVDERTLVGMNVLGRLLMELREIVKVEERNSLLRVEPIAILDFLLDGRPIGMVTAQAVEVASTVAQPVGYASLGDVDSRELTQPSLFNALMVKESVTPAYPDVSAKIVRVAELKPYPDYKEAGLPWLDAVPAHWGMVPNRALMQNQRQVVGENATDYKLLSLTLRGIIPRNMDNPKGKFPAKFNTYKVVRPEDLVFCLFDIDETPRGVGHSKLKGMITGAYDVFSPRQSINPRFLYYYYLSLDEGKLLKPLYTGLRKTIKRGIFASLKAPHPPLAEQAAIVRFLDWTNGRLERTIRAKRKVIALLTEQKQAIIHRAVTRGLPSTDSAGSPQAGSGQATSVPLKPSGIPWLGDIPQHWEVRRLRHLIKGRLTYGANAAAEFTNLDWPRYIRITDFRADGSLKADTFRSLPPRIACDYLVEPGDILLARSGATVGKAFLVVKDTGSACHAGYLIRARPHRGLVSPEFLFAFTQSRAFAAWKDSTFNTATIQNIGADKYANLAVPFPSLAEQQAILDSLSDEQAPLLTAISRLEREIELLREYRTRLVADVVTGKLDVREAASGLPEEATSDIAEVSDESETTDEEIAV